MVFGIGDVGEVNIDEFYVFCFNEVDDFLDGFERYCFVFLGFRKMFF